MPAEMRKKLGDLPNAADAAAAIRAGKTSSEELVREVLRRIETHDSGIGAYLSVDPDSALEQARQADRAVREGRSGRLLGVPIAVKDNINVRGQPCGCASAILKGYVSPYDATVIARLRAEGAVFLGRTNMDEFAMGSSTENSAFHPTRNPWNAEHVAGGSSGGSAAAVAGGEAVAALGSDTGGSVRQPASFCGCVGLKPSYGRVSRYGLTAYASSLDQIGTLTRDVRDAAFLLKIIAGADGMDATCLDRPVPDYEAEAEAGCVGMRIGLPKEYFVAGIDPDVEAAVRRAAAALASGGAELVEVSLPHTRYAVAAYYVLATAEASANLARYDGVRYGLRAQGAATPEEMYRRTRAAGFGTEVKRRIILGTFVLSSGYYDAYYLTAQKVRSVIRRDFDEAFARCDVILAPVTPAPAFRLGEMVADPLRMYLSDILTVPANLAGICGISVPCGFTPGGLPVGAQFLAPAFAEGALFRAARACENLRGSFAR